jgi:hypothetical protein
VIEPHLGVVYGVFEGKLTADQDAFSEQPSANKISKTLDQVFRALLCSQSFVTIKIFVLSAKKKKEMPS